MNQATLLFLIEGEKILLAMKKRGFGQGRYDGVGGKIEDAESIEAAARRECYEEIKVKPVDLTKTGELTFYFPDSKAHFNQVVHVFTCDQWRGEPTETEVMHPEWFDYGGIPYDNMWSDDRIWLPEVLSGQFVTADFHFDDDDSVIDYTVKLG